jgi:HEAT repeat protein
MKAKGDVDGLVRLMKGDNPQTRVEATEALAELGHQRATGLLIKELTDILRFGDDADKVEAIILMKGSTSARPAVSMSLDLPFDRLQRLAKYEKTKFRRGMDLHLVRPILYGLATNSVESPAIRWYSVVALAELGDKSDDLMQLLMDTFNSISNMNIYVIEETVRALSFLTGNPHCVPLLIRIQKGELFRGGLDVGWRSAAIYALGASGNASAREYLEYLASHGDDFYRKRARIALELFGKATYDEIEAKVKSKLES